VSSDESAEPEPAAPAQAPAAGPRANGAAAAPVIADVPAKVVDKQVALAENPRLREVTNGVNAGDPLTATTQSFFAAGSRVRMTNFQHQVDIMRELNDRYPTFDEFTEMMQVHQVEYKELKPWQMYAYDSSDGTVCILEDPDVKRARYEAIGLPYEEDE
jgi:hypothetical protein